MASKATIGHRLFRIYREDYFASIERLSSYVRPPVSSETLGSYIRQMKIRGFSSDAIARELEDLGLPVPSSIYDSPSAPISPLCRFPLCASKPSRIFPFTSNREAK